MRRSRPSPEHADAVSRRLATLSAELASLRSDSQSGAEVVAHQGVGHEVVGQAVVGQAVSGRPIDGPTWAGLAPVEGPDAVPGRGPDQAPRAVGSPGPPPAFVHDVDGHTRVRGAARGAEAVPFSPTPVVVRAPGRHAHRRGARPGADDALGRRWGIGPAHLAVVLTVLLIGLLGTTWVLLAGRAVERTPGTASEEPVSFAPAEPDGAESSVPGLPGAPDAPAASDGEQAAASVTVDVAGKVRRPGIAVLPVGSRVVDAIEAAGGARRGVDLSNLNLARVLVDGEQVLVGGGAAPATATVPSPSGAGGALVNINTADQTLLETLPGVGPVTAAAIIGWRTDNGSFTSVEELVEVDGIGEATLANLAPLVTV